MIRRRAKTESKSAEGSAAGSAAAEVVAEAAGSQGNRESRGKSDNVISTHHIRKGCSPRAAICPQEARMTAWRVVYGRSWRLGIQSIALHLNV